MIKTTTSLDKSPKTFWVFVNNDKALLSLFLVLWSLAAGTQPAVSLSALN